MTTISIRLDDGLKKQLDEMCAEMGMSLSTFYMIYTKRALRDRKIPFSIEAPERPNAKTLAAMDDVVNHRNLSRTFNSVDELMEDLNA